MGPDTIEVLEGVSHATDPKARIFQTLDGLRGFAALAVLVWHSPGGGHLLPSAYLAVDMFFMLSGFVLAYRYHDKLRTPADARRFVVIRLIRLYPLYLLGTLFGIVALCLPALVQHHLTMALLAKAALGLVMLPYLQIGCATFPFNVPAWSLFYELAINIVFGLTVRFTTPRVLLTVIGAAMAALVVAVWFKGSMHFTITMPDFALASLRAVFGFYTGVLLFRLRKQCRLPLWRVHPAVIVALLLPCFMVPPHSGIVTIALVLVVCFVAFPGIIVAGLANEPSGPLATTMQMLGLLSFPLYAIHWPLVKIVAWCGQRLHAPAIAILLAGAVVSLVGGLLAARYFDRPVTRWLGRIARNRSAWPETAPANTEFNVRG